MADACLQISSAVSRVNVPLPSSPRETSLRLIERFAGKVYLLKVNAFTFVNFRIPHVHIPYVHVVIPEDLPLWNVASCAFEIAIANGDNLRLQYRHGVGHAPSLAVYVITP